MRSGLPGVSIPCSHKGQDTPSHPFVTALGWGEAKCCPDSEEGAPHFPVCDVFQHRKEFGLSIPNTGRIHWVYVTYFEQGRRKVWKQRGETGAEVWGSESSSSGGTSEVPAHCCRDGDRGKLKQLNQGGKGSCKVFSGCSLQADEI